MTLPDPSTHLTRRHFFGRNATGLGIAALAHLMGRDAAAGKSLPGLPHFAPKAKHVIYLFQSGGPSQIDLFDHKPKLKQLHGTELPDSIRRGQRLTGMTASQTSFPVHETWYDFKQHGESGAWVSELLPHTAQIADKLSFIRTMHTEAINHDPAVTFLQTGAQLAGRPSIGAWLSYGLGTENEDLPAFVVMTSRGSGRVGQALYTRLWGSGFLPSRYQGVKFRSQGDPVLYLSNPEGVSRDRRRMFLDDLSALNRIQQEEFADPEIETRIAQYEMAYRMQTSVPELMDLSNEPDSTFDLYGEAAREPGTYARHCLVARRLVERGVRFVQLFHRGWDQHRSLPIQLPKQCADTDQASAALIEDLDQRGLLDETLVVWGGEFGRTVYCQGLMTDKSYGRDHHPRCFTIWLAGGGVKPAETYGETDDFCYNVVDKPVHVHDLHATLLQQLGIDHTKLTYSYQGRQFRLTDVGGEIIRDLVS
ncbi:MAG: DUF1501 domain-containing protein [Acidobacteriia bacterium]|nr:DUF1501 domain-containing protein [Terriglobia bacterium]MYK09578.1 DUF1501 domain-containing protein [Terriglobia bacterium]